ncbi:MAG: carboxypeptidase regulatory-like domain-containing protein, partial [Saprospiraceae bacterium]|nr:carboxypeptidase regulatory-like domain-containing protein [Saprospiraceae bacterium]
MKSSIFTTIVLLFLAHILYGQSTYTIAGRVIDSTGSPLIAATTVVIDPIDSTMVTYGITNEDGSFILPSV